MEVNNITRYVNKINSNFSKKAFKFALKRQTNNQNNFSWNVQRNRTPSVKYL